MRLPSATQHQVSSCELGLATWSPEAWTMEVSCCHSENGLENWVQVAATFSDPWSKSSTENENTLSYTVDLSVNWTVIHGFVLIVLKASFLEAATPQTPCHVQYTWRLQSKHVWMVWLVSLLSCGCSAMMAHKVPKSPIHANGSGSGAGINSWKVEGKADNIKFPISSFSLYVSLYQRYHYGSIIACTFCAIYHNESNLRKDDHGWPRGLAVGAGGTKWLSGKSTDAAPQWQVHVVSKTWVPRYLQDMLKHAMAYHQGPHQKGQILAVAAHLDTIRATCNPHNRQVLKLRSWVVRLCKILGANIDPHLTGSGSRVPSHSSLHPKASQNRRFDPLRSSKIVRAAWLHHLICPNVNDFSKSPVMTRSSQDQNLCAKQQQQCRKYVWFWPNDDNQTLKAT